MSEKVSPEIKILRDAWARDLEDMNETLGVSEQAIEVLKQRLYVAEQMIKAKSDEAKAYKASMEQMKQQRDHYRKRLSWYMRKQSREESE